jgi:predicted HTH domain antitoxin
MSSKKYEIMKVKTLRLKDSVSSLIATIAKEKNLSDSEYIRSLVEKDIYKYKIDKAINAYKKREVNISKGAEIAGISYREFLDVLEDKNIPLNMDDFSIDYGLSSIEKSLEFLTTKKKKRK